MTQYYKVIDNGYIIGIGTHGNDTVTPITNDEYNSIVSIINTRPTPPIGYKYMLRADSLEWELVELPPAPDPGKEEIEDSEALDIILGGVKL